MRDTLYVFRPGFTDQGERWFCPYSAQVTGMLAYFPQLHATLDVVELDFTRPREPVATMLGEAHQSLPVLVLGEGSPVAAPGVHVAAVGERRFVSKTIEILRYLAVTRGLPGPH